MIENSKKYTDFLIKHKITADQYLFCYLLYTADYANLYAYTETLQTVDKQMVNDLVRKGLIDNIAYSSSMRYIADCYEVTNKFLDSYLLSVEDPAKDFWDAYPDFMWIEGKRIPIKTADYDDEFVPKYNKSVNFRKKIHQRAMKALEYEKNSTTSVSMGIMKWIGSRRWEMIEKDMVMETEKSGDFYGGKEF